MKEWCMEYPGFTFLIIFMSLYFGYAAIASIASIFRRDKE